MWKKVSNCFYKKFMLECTCKPICEISLQYLCCYRGSNMAWHLGNRSSNTLNTTILNTSRITRYVNSKVQVSLHESCADFIAFIFCYESLDANVNKKKISSYIFSCRCKFTYIFYITQVLAIGVNFILMILTNIKDTHSLQWKVLTSTST